MPSFPKPESPLVGSFVRQSVQSSAEGMKNFAHQKCKKSWQGVEKAYIRQKGVLTYETSSFSC